MKMSYYTRAKRRKMETHVGGDNCRAKLSTKQDTPPSHQIQPSGSASGDFNFVPQTHQYIAIVSERSADITLTSTNDYRVCKTACDMGDRWAHKFTLPLSNYPNRTIRTGDSDTDVACSVIPQYGYRPLQVVGKGRYGTIVMAQNLNHRTSEYTPVALKVGKGKAKRKNRGCCKLLEPTEWESNILRHIHHENIISLIDTLHLNNQTVLVLEFCENGNLDSLLKAQYAKFITEPIARKYFRQLFSAVEYIHHQNIAHRDICNHNILISQTDSVKLSDFGHAVRFYSFDALCEDMCGTCSYQAPEIVSRVPFNPKIADIWSLGCVLYSMTIGRLPFGIIKAEYLPKTQKGIIFPCDHIMPLSDDLKELIKGLLSYLTEERYTLNRIKYSAWTQKRDDKVHIGNFYLIRQPQKVQEGDKEKEMKKLYGI